MGGAYFISFWRLCSPGLYWSESWWFDKCKAKKVTSVCVGVYKNNKYSACVLWWTLGIATIRKTVNVLSINNMYFVEIHVYNVK
jgi:hypothetical protein